MPSLDPLGRGLVEKRLARLATDELRIVEGGETRIYGAAPNPDSLSATLHVHDSRLWSGIARRGLLGAAEAFLDGRWSASRAARAAPGFPTKKGKGNHERRSRIRERS